MTDATAPIAGLLLTPQQACERLQRSRKTVDAFVRLGDRLGGLV